MHHIYNSRKQSFYENVYFLKKFDMFNQISNEKLLNLLENCENRKLQKEDVLYSKNDVPDKVYFLKKGELELNDKIQLP